MAKNAFSGPERRNEKPGRRASDYTTCVFHEGTCDNIEEIWASVKGKAPIWVIGLLVSLAVATFGGVALMIRDVKMEVAALSSVVHAVEVRQEVMLEKFKAIFPGK